MFKAWWNILNTVLLQIYYPARQWKKWKPVNIWWSYGQEFGVLFFDSQCAFVTQVISQVFIQD